MIDCIKSILFSRWFALAVGILITLRIVLFVYFVVVNGNYIHPDSPLYIDLAISLLENHFFALSSETQNFAFESSEALYGPQVFRTPGYPLFLAAISALGMKSPYWAVFWQEIIYGMGCYIFYRYGKSLFGLKIARLGLFFLLVEPGGLAFPKLLVSETLFLPFAVTGILFTGFYLKTHNWRYLIFAGVIMGLGALIRPAILYLPVVVATALIYFDWRNRNRWKLVSYFLLTFILVVSPWLVRNYLSFDKIFFSGQQSNMLSKYHVPHVLNAAGVLGYYESQQFMREQVAQQRVEQEKRLGRELDGVEFFQLQQQVAISQLIKYPMIYFTQWLRGILKGMYVPFIIELDEAFRSKGEKSPYIEILPEQVKAENSGVFGFRLSFFFSRVSYYLQNQDRLFLLNLGFSLLMTGGALLGVISIIEKRNQFLLIMLLANFYFICLPGPMGYARFRFPIGVFWFIQAWMGFVWLFHLLSRYRQVDR